MSINLNDNIQVNSGKPLDSRYLNGLSAYVSVAAVNSAIPISTRYLGLTVLIATVEYWYQNAITDVGLIVKSGGAAGTSQPIIRYVYLVADAADATSMGGTAKNTYTTFQTAYDAANTLQVTLGGFNIVVIQVGNITAGQAGILTLTANYNFRVQISGINQTMSVLGNIVATSTSGNGFSIISAQFNNITIGNITTNATGTTGNSGIITIGGNNLRLGILSTNITNVGNTTGSGGNIVITSTNATISTGTITTTSQSTTSNAGNVTLNGVLLTGNITTANNNLLGILQINNTSNVMCTAGNLICKTLTQSSTPSNRIIINRCSFTSGNFLLGGNATNLLTTHLFNDCYFNNLTILNNSVAGLVTLSNCKPKQTDIIALYTSDSLIATRLYQSVLSSISNLGDNSIVYNCIIVGYTTAYAIQGIGNNCNIINCTIDSITGGISSIYDIYNNGTAVSVLIRSTSLSLGVSPEITILP